MQDSQPLPPTTEHQPEPATSLPSSPQPSYSRLAILEDADALVRFINQAYARDNYFKRTGRTDAQQLTQYLSKGSFLLIEENGELIGSVYVELRGEGRGYLGMLAVGPSKQGQGIGGWLLQAGEEFCRQHGCRIVEESVVHLRPELVDWYERHGYRVVGEAPYERPEILLQPCHFILLEKDLSVVE